MLTYQEHWNPKYLRDSNSCAAKNLTWNPNKASNMILLFNWVIFRFHVNFPVFFSKMRCWHQNVPSWLSMIVSKETISLWARHVARSKWVTCTLNQDERKPFPGSPTTIVYKLIYNPPFFEGRVYNHPKYPRETTIFWMVVDFQGIPMRWNQLWLRDCESNIFETYTVLISQPRQFGYKGGASSLIA